MQKISLLLFLILAFVITSCDNGGNDDPFVVNRVSSASGITTPSGVTATTSAPLTFAVRVDGVFGDGSFSGVFESSTGTVNFSGLSIAFGTLSNVGVNAYQAIGTISGPIAGEGTATILVNYDEPVNSFSSRFIITVISGATVGAFITTPVGASANTSAAYTFPVRVDGVFGLGSFSAVFAGSTGTASFAGLTIAFSPITALGTSSFQSVGTISGPFSGDGTVTVAVSYAEGADVFTSSFIINVNEIAGIGTGIITPTGATANNSSAYVFPVQVDGVVGTGGFSAVFSGSTGTASSAGLSLSFTPIVLVGSNSFQSIGSVSGPFVGEGSIAITVTYTEGFVTFSSSFIVSVNAGIGITTPIGATANTTAAYTFPLRVDGVVGTGAFTGSFIGSTGTASFAGLTLSFSGLSAISTQAYEAVGSVSAPFSGDGTITISVTYTEGLTVFTSSFVVNVGSSTFSGLILPSGSEAVALTSIPYSFPVRVDEVLGTGALTASITSSTGTVGSAGLTIGFSPLTMLGANSFESIGTLSGLFTGEGTVTISVTYTEGATVFTSSFIAAINSTTNIIPPSGIEATASSTTAAYNFVVGVNGVLGTGSFTGTFGPTTGTVSTAGLTIGFSALTSAGGSLFESIGTVSAPFTGQGTVAVSLTYTEGATVLTAGFIVNVNPSGPSGLTLPSGIEATVNSGTPYIFTTRVDGVIGTGTFTGSFVSATGTVDFTGLSIAFAAPSLIGTNAFQSVGTVSGPFSGAGTVTISVTYTEGTTVFTSSFVATVNSTSSIIGLTTPINAIANTTSAYTFVVRVDGVAGTGAFTGAFLASSGTASFAGLTLTFGAPIFVAPSAFQSIGTVDFPFSGEGSVTISVTYTEGATVFTSNFVVIVAPEGNSGLTLPSGSEATANTTDAYTFAARVDGVVGTGTFTGVFAGTTGSTTTTGLSIGFAASSLIGTNAFQSIATLSGPFTGGSGTATITVTYTEGITVFVGSFVVTVTADPVSVTALTFSPLSPLLLTTVSGVPTITATGTPAGGTIEITSFTTGSTGGTFTLLDPSAGTFSFSGFTATGTATAEITYTEPLGGTLTATYIVTVALPSLTPLLAYNHAIDSISDASTIVVPISVSGGPAPAGGLGISDLNVLLDISHPNPSDLDILLVAPDGTTIDLTSDNGSGSLDAFATVTFDDAAPTSITTISAAGGTFKPEGLLSDFDGLDANGTWLLVITDDFANGLIGTIRTVALFFDGTTDVPIPLNPISFSIGGPIAIPDFGAGSLSLFYFVVSGPTTTSKVTLRVTFTHALPNELNISLENPFGTVITLTPPGGFPVAPGGTKTITFDDDAPTPISAYSGASGFYSPATPLSSFNGLDSEGDWTLTISDDTGADVGTHDSSTLAFDGA